MLTGMPEQLAEGGLIFPPLVSVCAAAQCRISPVTRSSECQQCCPLKLDGRTRPRASALCCVARRLSGADSLRVGVRTAGPRRSADVVCSAKRSPGALSYTYAPAGEIGPMTGTDNAVWSYTCDLQGRKTETVEPDKGQITSE